MNEFHCEQCGSCFTRQEHLARHARTHTKEKPHLCFECGKSFSRRDALLRHSASHASAARVTSAFSRACRQCAASRARCTRDQPCGRCSDKGLFCDYPPSRRKRGNSSCAQPSNGLQGALDTPGRSEGVGVSDDPWSTLTPVAGQETLEQVPGCWPVTNDFAFSQVHAVQSATCGVMQPLAMSAMNWLPPESSMPPNWEAWQAGISNGRPSNDMGPPSSMPAHLVDNAQNGQPWREPEGDSGVDVSGRIATMPTSAGTDRDSPRGPSSPQSVQSEGAPSAGDATLYVDGASTRLPFKGRCAESHTKERNVEQAASVVSSEDESELPSPWSQPVNTPSAASKPRDRSVLTGHLSAEAFSHLVLQLQSRSSAEIDVSEGRLPMLRYMRAFLRLYFRHFHPAWPFLPPDLTYYEEPTRWILLLAVTAVGSRYTTGGQCVRYSELLCDVLGRSNPLLLDEMQQNLPADDTSVRKTSGTPRKEDALAVLQAAVLDIASKCHDSRFASPTAAFAQIFATVDLCRSTGLLKTMQSSSVEGSGVSVLDEWMWRQLRIRTGLMIWALDSMISFEFCRNPLFRLDDAAVSLPCRASLWEHPTYDGVETSDKHSVTIPKAMEILYMEKGLPPNTDNLGTNILIFAICRRTREAFQHYQTPLASWVPTARVRRESSTYANHTKVEECWPPSLPILSKWRNSACDCLDILHWNANGTVAKAGGWEHPAVLNLHLSRLLILAPTQDLQRMAASISSENCSSEGSEIGRRANLIFQWACKDQHKARLSVIHAGALLWHIRRYCVGSFLEPFAAFAATLVIWAYSSGRQQKKPHLSDSRDPRRMEEDSDTIFLHLDRPLDDELVQEFVVSGDKMAGHLAGVGDIRSEGAPGKILKMGMGVLTDVKLGRHFARDEEPVGDDWPGVWGIEQVYIDRLERLMEIS